MSHGTPEQYKAWVAANLPRRREIDREHRRKNHAAIRAREIAFHAARPLYSAVKRAKTRAKQFGLPFDLDDRTLERPEFCPVLGLRLRYAERQGKCGPDSPSIDRLRPALGYVKNNVRVISHRANTIKSDATVAELRAVLDYCSRNVLD